MDVAVVDYGMGNLRSVSRALGVASGRPERVRITSDPEEVRRAPRVVLPGVGAIGDCMAELGRLGLLEVVREAAQQRPFLGICLGMQALVEESEESGGVAGLGVLPGRCIRFPEDMRDAAGRRLKVPHMGWSEVHQEVAHPLWAGVPDGACFYFVHGYFVEAGDREAVAGRAFHGRPFAAALSRGPCFAVQFHPEKSQKDGLRLLANFMEWRPA